MLGEYRARGKSGNAFMSIVTENLLGDLRGEWGFHIEENFKKKKADRPLIRSWGEGQGAVGFLPARFGLHPVHKGQIMIYSLL